MTVMTVMTVTTKQTAMTEYEIKKELLLKTHEIIEKANSVFNVSINMPYVSYKLKGRCAGQHVTSKSEIRYNVGLATENWENFLENIVIHEVAHYVTYNLYGTLRTRKGKIISHGDKWKYVMTKLGCKNIKRCHTYDVSKVSQSRTKSTARFQYKCDCRFHNLKQLKHKRARLGTSYICNVCHTKAIFIKQLSE